ncbi:twin-arginine translocation signal domain-containing protein [Cutibacterium acnes]|nr:twin-arginine translocation signal domain-containing protein [Cutibacterium acnes]
MGIFARGDRRSVLQTSAWAGAAVATWPRHDASAGAGRLTS